MSPLAPVRRRRHQTHPCTRITRRRRPCRHARGMSEYQSRGGV